MTLQEITAFAKEYGFIFPSSEIYDGVKAVYDYGHYGSLLKQNVKNLWIKSMVQEHNDIVNLDSAIFMHPTIWKASGHVDNFDDLMIDNKDSKKRYRVDTMIEDFAADLMKKGEKERAGRILANLKTLLNDNDLEGLRNLFIEENIVCPISKTCNWTAVRHFNLMFYTQTSDDEILYLRPETAQGIYVNFNNIQKSTRLKVPFGIAQVGKAFRNEIIARQFTFRMKEFEQMEMQFFIQPDTDKEWFVKWKETRMQWYRDMGIPANKLHFKPHDKLAHYARAAEDIEYEFDFGFKEIEGIHARGDFDLSNHEKFSNKNLKYFDAEKNMSYIPHVIETSCGCDRIVLMLLSEFLQKENVADKERTVLKLPYNLTPIKIAVLPLMKKDGMAEKAKDCFNVLKKNFMCAYDETQSIGKRYVRNDLIGTKFCITVDYQTLEDNTVTVRDRDDMQQVRIPFDSVEKYVNDKIK